MNRLPSLFRSTGGASAAEFAIVLPLLLVLLFGVIDTGRFMWDVNRAEKATQAGVRMAAVTTALAPGLITENYADQTVDGVKLKPGDVIPAAALGTVLCNSSGCTCETGNCPADLGTLDSTTFNQVLVGRMQAIMPAITAQNVEVRYSGSGLGTAGSLPVPGTAETMEISPLITVSLVNMQFKPITTLLFATIDLPGFESTMTAEDVSGTFSN